MEYHNIIDRNIKCLVKHHLPLREKMSAKPTDEGRSSGARRLCGMPPRSADREPTQNRRPCRKLQPACKPSAALDLPSSPSLRSGPSPARGERVTPAGVIHRRERRGAGNALAKAVQLGRIT